MSKQQEYTCNAKIENNCFTVKVYALTREEAQLKAAAILARKKAFQNTITVHQKG